MGNILKDAAIKNFDLVEKSNFDALQKKYDALVHDNKNFVVVEDVDGNAYNTVGETITDGQELRVGAVEGEGDLVVDATIEFENGTVTTDADGVVTITRPEEGEGDDTEASADAAPEVVIQKTLSEEDVDAKITKALKKQRVAIKSDLDAFFSKVETSNSEATKIAKSVEKTFNEAPAVTKNIAKALNAVTKADKLANKLAKSSKTK